MLQSDQEDDGDRGKEDKMRGKMRGNWGVAWRIRARSSHTAERASVVGALWDCAHAHGVHQESMLPREAAEDWKRFPGETA